MERKRKVVNGHIVVKNPLAYEIPKREVIIKSGRTLYRFTGNYDGNRALSNKVLRLMVKAVYVHVPDKSSGQREQQIDISYDLVGILPVSLLYDLSNGETA